MRNCIAYKLRITFKMERTPPCPQQGARRNFVASGPFRRIGRLRSRELRQVPLHEVGLAYDRRPVLLDLRATTELGTGERGARSKAVGGWVCTSTLGTLGRFEARLAHCWTLGGEHGRVGGAQRMAATPPGEVSHLSRTVTSHTGRSTKIPTFGTESRTSEFTDLASPSNGWTMLQVP